MESSAACCGTSVRAGGRASAATAAKSRQARSPAQQLRVRAAGRLAKADPHTVAALLALAAACCATQRRRARRPARWRRGSGICPAGAAGLARAAAVAARWRRHASSLRCWASAQRALLSKGGERRRRAVVQAGRAQPPERGEFEQARERVDSPLRLHAARPHGVGCSPAAIGGIKCIMHTCGRAMRAQRSAQALGGRAAGARPQCGHVFQRQERGVQPVPCLLGIAPVSCLAALWAGRPQSRGWPVRACAPVHCVGWCAQGAAAVARPVRVGGAGVEQRSAHI